MPPRWWHLPQARDDETTEMFSFSGFFVWSEPGPWHSSQPTPSSAQVPINPGSPSWLPPGYSPSYGTVRIYRVFSLLCDRRPRSRLRYCTGFCFGTIFGLCDDIAFQVNKSCFFVCAPYNIGNLIPGISRRQGEFCITGLFCFTNLRWPDDCQSLNWSV